MISKNEISEKLWLTGSDPGDPNADMMAMAGPVAEHIVRLEKRIEELEAKSMPVITNITRGEAELPSNGLSVSDVIALTQALKGKE